MIADLSPLATGKTPALPSTVLIPQHPPATVRVNRVATELESSSVAGRQRLPATRPFGNYELIEEIARGGMGIVYKARQIALDRIVALKIVLPAPFPSKSAARRLQFEAQVGASLDHPGIVPVHDFGEYDGRPYLCLAFVDGESVAERVEREPLPPAEAARIVGEVAESIQYVHDCGILHRDIKPANILIDSSGRSRLIDFGVARRIDGRDDAGASGRIAGTPSYMSPEQAAGRNELVGPASDVYSLGAVLHELLTGRPAFEGSSSRAILKKACQVESGNPRNDDSSIPKDLQAICRRALRKAAEARYASAGDLARDLRRYGRHASKIPSFG